MKATVAKKRDGEDLSTGEKLLAGAADLFRRKGYAATTTRELSALLGIQNASLYYHMEKKEDLLYKLCLHTLEDVARVMESSVADASDPLERLKLIAHRYTTTALRDRDRHTTMLIEIRALSPDRRRRVVDVRDGNVAVVRQTIAAAQKAGQVRRDYSPKYLSLMLFNLMNWSIFWYRPDGELTRDQIAEMTATLFLEGVATGTGSKVRKRVKSRSARTASTTTRSARVVRLPRPSARRK
jgi:AcrR family transcriptional regulator